MSVRHRTTGDISALFFSRGRGRGHAIPDIAIVKELERIDCGMAVQFVSYASGAETLEAEGYNVVDLALPEDNSFSETVILAYRTISESKPTVVISHEEFAALVAAKLAGVPSIFVAPWLPPYGTVGAEALTYARAIVVIGHPGIFPIPPGVAVRPSYVGPILRRMKYTLDDRPRLRQELGIAHNDPAILVVPGGWTEDVAPICDVVLSAFAAVQSASKRLYWLAGRDFELLRNRTAGIPGIQIFKYFSPIEGLIVPCDVVITKGTHGITLDAASLGVPSISLSFGLNPIDDILVPRIRNNTPLNAHAVDGAVLLEFIEAMASRRSAQSSPAADSAAGRGAEMAAQRIVEAIREITA